MFSTAGQIYMDYQATTPTDRRVVAAMQPYWSEIYGNPHSADHAFGWSADSAVEAARRQIAELIAADPDEIVFTSGATEANNLAILGIARASSADRRRIIVSAIEHKCVLAAARAAVEEGFEVVTAPVNADGLVDVAVLADLIDPRVALVSIMMVNNEIGSVQPLTEIAALCAAVGAIFHSDAAQALSVLPIDVTALGVDLMSLSAHKAYGPKGIGALYVRRGLAVRPKPIIHGGGQEEGLRAGTLPTPLCVGFGEACHILVDERGPDAARIGKLRDRLLAKFRATVPDLEVNGTLADRHPGNLNVRCPAVDASVLLQNLHPHVAASTGSACTSGQPEPSHVLRALGLSAKEANASIRLSIGRFTTDGDVDRAVEYLGDAYRTSMVT
jgi:cysteine desulfurase